MNKEYKEKEDVMMRIIMENGGLDMDAVINGDGFKQTSDILK